MTSSTAKRVVTVAAMVWAVDSASSLRAQIGIGTWVRRSDASAGGGLTMTVEACCHGGRRLIYHVGDLVMTVESPMDGTDVPVLVGGKPSGETMGIRRVDDHHTFTVLKMSGRTFGTSKSTLSGDGKTLIVESEITLAEGGRTVGKVSETWVRR